MYHKIKVQIMRSGAALFLGVAAFNCPKMMNFDQLSALSKTHLNAKLALAYKCATLYPET